MMAPIIDYLTDDYLGRAAVGKLDIDENNAVAQKYGIRSVPTVLIFKGGEIVDKSVGYQSREALSKKLNQALGV